MPALAGVAFFGFGGHKKAARKAARVLRMG